MIIDAVRIRMETLWKIGMSESCVSNDEAREENFLVVRGYNDDFV